MRIEPDEAAEVAVAAIVGVPELARELERLGLVTEDESLEEARALRPMILDAAEAARKEASG